MTSTIFARGDIRTRPVRLMADVEANALEAELRAGLRGEVRFDAGSRAMYTTDSAIFRRVPIGVVLPRDADDAAEAVAICRRFGAPILGRGGGTSISGNSCNVAVVIDMSKHMNHIWEVDPDRRIARVQPGVICDRLRDAAEEYHLTFAPDPSTHNHCCIGGMAGNNSCGIHSVMGGRTADNIHELEILTYDGLRLRVGPTPEDELYRIIAEGGRRGDIYARLLMIRNKYGDLIRERYPDIPRRCSGYCLDELLPEKGFNVARALVGSEGTCVLFLEATCRLIPSPPERVLMIAGFPDIATAGDHVPMILEHGPTGLEGIDEFLVDSLKAKAKDLKFMPLLPAGRGWLYVEFGGETREEAIDKANRLIARLQTDTDVIESRLYEDHEEAQKVWKIRHEGLALTRVPGYGDLWPGWEDGAVHPNVVGAYIRDLRKLIASFGYTGSLFAHIGQGCLHTRTNFDLTTVEGVKKYRAFMEAAADLVVSYGGSLSGEHGDGQYRSELLPKMFGPELVEAFREFKAIWDPDNKMNPGIKVEPPYKLDQDLRTGPDYRPAQPETFFRFPDDAGSFAYATERCIGVGTCRKEDSGTMCPSYMATREEMHSTRGRSRLLFEMIRGDVLDGGWRDEHVHEALDLCLACKGCKSECPNNVDMASYKAEFFAHYYAGRLRPRAAYAMGLIPYWARLGSLMPEVVNALMNAPGLGDLIKILGGISTQRRPPAFAPATFKDWLRRRGPRREFGPPVILWADTFNNHFHPEVAKAAVEVLEDAGCRVIVPMASLCCGRPLYDFGMLPSARRFLRRILDALREPIRAGIPVVVLEPGCASVFRDELTNLFPNDRDAQRLRKQTLTLAEFLVQKAPEFIPPRLRRKALVHAHCHHKAIMTTDAEEQVLQGLGLDYGKILDSGCCGMAGSFGFEADKYAISMQIGEQRLLPAVRAAARDTLIIADGFSCKHQIKEGTDRQALHLAQVLQMALHQAPDGPLGGYPEVLYPDVRLHGPERLRATLRTASILGIGALLAGGAAYALARRRST
jgi:FAD/FMN-containing dehydrogenase/Fe-S oxidoreductase